MDFLQKPDADATQENLINRLERLIFHISMIADINDENFGSASGIALRYRLQSMHNLFLVKSRKFTGSIRNRCKVIFSNPVARTHGVSPDDWMSVRVKFTPNLPADILSEVRAAQQADGMLNLFDTGSSLDPGRPAGRRDAVSKDTARHAVLFG